MNLDSLTMDKSAARQAFLEYRAAFRAEHERIDGELMRGYKAMSQGRQLIRLSETIQRAGVDAAGYPRLAIARADEREIEVYRWRDGEVVFRPVGGVVRARDRRLAFPAGTLPVLGPDEYRQTKFALVPIIPPRFRPPHRAAGYHILWEAEWMAQSKTLRAPRDPALLKHLGGDLWAVLAVWDLTPLEQAVLEMRSN